MPGDEARVTAAFVRWLQNTGWTARLEVAGADVFAERGDERLVGEVKGRTAAVGLDVDTAYGQLLRRMAEVNPTGVRYAIVVPTAAIGAALRVPPAVRTTLGIDVYEVDDDDHVHPR